LAHFIDQRFCFAFEYLSNTGGPESGAFLVSRYEVRRLSISKCTGIFVGRIKGTEAAMHDEGNKIALMDDQRPAILFDLTL
jgi:hypothetical protein